MSNIMEYKGYHAKIEYSSEDRVFVGHVLGINDTLAFDGETIDELECMFHDNIDDYLEMCKELGVEPDKEYKGSFNVRISPELHKKAAFEAEQRNTSLNQFVALSIENEINNYHVREKEVITIIMPPQAIKDYMPFLPGGNYPVAKFEDEGTMIECKKITTKLSLSA